MATPRFYRVLRGQRGAAAKTKFLDYLEGLGQGQNVGQGRARPDRIKLFIQPFGQTLPTDVYLEASAEVPSWNALDDYASINTRTKATLGGTESSIKFRGVKPARLVRRTKDATGAATTSKLTGLRYLKYNTTSVSVPFGRKNATDRIADAFEEMFTEIPGTFAVSLIDEAL